MVLEPLTKDRISSVAFWFGSESGETASHPPREILHKMYSSVAISIFVVLYK